MNKNRVAKELIGLAKEMIGARGPFLTDWEYNTTVESGGKTIVIWQCQHRDGYTAYTTTRQPENGRSFVKPIGTGHYVGEIGLKNKTGIVVTPN